MSLCLPLYLFLLSLVGWCVRLPKGLVSLCLPLCPFLFPFVGSCVHLSEGLVSPCLRLCPFFFPSVGCCAPSCFPLLDGASAFPRVLSPFVSHCAPSCFPSLDGVSEGSRLPFSPVDSCLVRSPVRAPCLRWHPFLFPFVGWCVRLSEGLVSDMFTFSMSCLPLVSQCFRLSPHMCACVGWCVRLPDVLSPLAPHCLRVSPHTLDCASPFRRSCLRLSPITVSPHVCLCWMVRPPSGGLVSPLSPIVSHLVSLCWMVCPPCRGFVSPVSQLVSQLVFLLGSLWWVVCFCIFSNSVLLGVLKAFLRCPPSCWMVRPPSRGLVSYLVCQFVSLLVSLCGGWSHFAFFPKQCTVRGS